ncbi:hypothetical protein C1H57_09110 [Clostridium sp. 2-1]|uniref:hypothetical protein n=1 Tax=Clostridium TaxID=1485 RepID=UPI000CDA6DB8|nr:MULTISPECIES: hypothetical protein [Clostridium]MBN7575329.1 hypothetical protein [Clostridium beijerinckii]MBN7580635.1 hypothetical protein [Clostridium beijerinckii]MBN7585093.1 hypothetical protein [Clostridium beijerinckii]MBO0520979.1 hypothetical protein [Clostridium beijerinckii]POO91663.1 hypothetical protein C1H57_09110 [Clostridium sp. 2-1]
MLEFEDILKKYCVYSERDVEVIEALDIEECRKSLDKKIKNHKNTIVYAINLRKKAEEKQMLLLKKSISENITKRVNNRDGKDINEILCDLKTNKLIVGESVNKLKDIFNSLEKVKEYHIKEENTIIEEFKIQCKNKSLDSLEIKILERYVSSDEFRNIMNI